MEQAEGAAYSAEQAHVDTPDITLDNLVGLVEKAARIVDHLQRENAVLVDDLKDHQTALQSATMKTALQAARIQALESEIEQMRQDAQWWRWFHAKYHNSTFFGHIEREYAASRTQAEPEGEGSDEGSGDVLAA